jgi:uncharacterized protein YndB with AHSA1/START domain
MTQSKEKLIAEDAIEINASPSKVWDILVIPRCIKEWDDVPDSFTSDSLSLGAVLEWEGQARLTVTEFAPQSRLYMAYHSPNWNAQVPGIGYEYILRSSDDSCGLTIRVGDWALAPDGKGRDYFEASLDFVVAATAKIKEMAERS